MLPTLLLPALIFLLIGIALRHWGRQRFARSGLPKGEIIYDDSGAWEKVEKPLLSRRFGLVGRPDYLVRIGSGRKATPIPIEVKSRKRPRVAYESHILQLGAYCLLVEDHFQNRPAYGLLRYADATLKIPFTDALRQQVLEIAEEIRRARHARDVARQHQSARRCGGCGYRDACGDQAILE